MIDKSKAKKINKVILIFVGNDKGVEYCTQFRNWVHIYMVDATYLPSITKINSTTAKIVVDAGGDYFALPR